MRITAYRLTQTKYMETAFDGEGARLNGGRWNSLGTRMVYTASSLSLATLEILVHTEDISVIYELFSVIPISFDHSLVKTISGKSLPQGWNAPQSVSETQIIGDRWIEQGSLAILEVPSAVTGNESNYLINPFHPDFSLIKIDKRFRFEPYERFRKSEH